MKSTLFLVLGLLGACSCSTRFNRGIDKFISKHGEEDFSQFVGTSISYRDSDFGTDIFIVAKQGGKHPPYVVRINKSTKQITTIDDKFLRQSNHEPYFNHEQIRNFMKRFLDFDAQLLSVDKDSNVFIRPYYAEYSAILLRLNTKAGDTVIRKGIVYNLYRDNWYLSAAK